MRFNNLATLLVVLAPALYGYSVLTHEAIIDTNWDGGIKPLLKAKFPNSTPEDLKNAHAFAYGGCVIQDMGYYPFGSHLFTDLAHYVRTGDFVLNLLRDAQTLDEYAFALGALAHYAADTQGHPIGINRSVPIEYPKMRREYGSMVTYEDNPTDHLRVEFSFDALQVGRGAYAPQDYHDFIGFQVAKPLLERAFHDTYGLDLSDLFLDLDLTLGVYRSSVGTIIPEATKAAWSLKQKDLEKTHPGIRRRAFVYYLSRASYHKSWDKHDDPPGVGAHILAFFIRIFPKIGMFKILHFKTPSPAAESFFEASFDRTVVSYRTLLERVGAGRLQLADLDLDTGRATAPGEYRLADDTYAKLAVKLASKDPATVDPKVRENILAFFGNLNGPFATRKDRREWKATVAAVEKLKAQESTSLLKK